MDDLLNQISHDQYLFKVDDYMPSAWIGHAPVLKFLIRELKPAIFVELGVHNGFSYFVGCQAISECKLETKAFAVDHWLGDQQAGYFDESVFEFVKKLNSKYSRFSTLIRKSFADAQVDFLDSSIDILHIDGYHTYDSVKRDFESWLPKMHKDGVILLHDIHVRRNTFGVFKFWAEIEPKYNTVEFVGSHGLGVVFFGAIPNGSLNALVEYAKQGNMPQIQGTFGSISDDVIQNSRNITIFSAVAERDTAVAERDTAVAERDTAVAERDTAVAERDTAVAERDTAVAERDTAVAERDGIKESNLWRISAPYRKCREYLSRN